MDFYTVNLTNNTREMVNPFTKEVCYTPIDNPISEYAKERLKQYLLELGATSEEDDTYVYIALSNNTFLRLGIFNFLESDTPIAIAFEYDELDASLAKVLFEICKKGELAIRSGSNEEPVAIFEKDNQGLLSKRWPKLEKIYSAENLLEWMKKTQHKSL